VLAATQTLTNKTLTSPAISSAAFSGTQTGAFSSNNAISGLTISSSGVSPATAASRYVGATTSGSPGTGTFSLGDFVVDQTGAFWICTIAGSPGTWLRVGGVGILATPNNTTSSTGTVTVSSTETFDTTIGYYAVTLVSGNRYRVVYDGLVGNGNVQNDTYALNIRDSGSASNPTSSSTLIITTTWTVLNAGSSGRTLIPMRGTFVAGSGGTHTFGVSATRTGGTGAFTPITSPNSFRELYVEAV
jgi:hypothetical protein